MRSSVTQPSKRDDVVEPERVDPPHHLVREAAAADEDDPQVGKLVAQERRRLDDRVLAVALLDRAVADDGEAGLARRRLVARPQRLRVGAVQHHGDALRGRAALDVQALQLLGDGQRVVGEADRPLLEALQHGRQPARAVERLGELRDRLLHVRDDARAEELRHDRREHEEVRHRVDLHHVVGPPDVAHGERRGGEQPEPGVVERVAQPCSSGRAAPAG